jgi:hypothetical protein
MRRAQWVLARGVTNGPTAVAVEHSNEICPVLVTESFENEVIGDVARRLSFARSMSIREIKTEIRFVMARKKGSQRIYYRALPYIVRTNQHIQSGLKLQLGVTQLSEVFDRRLSEVHIGLHPCLADEILSS